MSEPSPDDQPTYITAIVLLAFLECLAFALWGGVDWGDGAVSVIAPIGFCVIVPSIIGSALAATVNAIKH